MSDFGQGINKIGKSYKQIALLSGNTTSYPKHRTLVNKNHISSTIEATNSINVNSNNTTGAGFHLQISQIAGGGKSINRTIGLSSSRTDQKLFQSIDMGGKSGQESNILIETDKPSNNQSLEQKQISSHTSSHQPLKQHPYGILIQSDEPDEKSKGPALQMKKSNVSFKNEQEKLREEKLHSQEYNQFQQNFQRIVFDKQNNYIFTQTDTQLKSSTNIIDETLENMEKDLKQRVEAQSILFAKNKNLLSDQVQQKDGHSSSILRQSSSCLSIDSQRKQSQEQNSQLQEQKKKNQYILDTQNRRSIANSYLNDAKVQSMNQLSALIKSKYVKEVFQMSKQEIAEFNQKAKDSIEMADFERLNVDRNNENYKLNLLEAEMQSDQLRAKNRQLEEIIQKLKSENTILKKENSFFDKYRITYETLSLKFSNSSLQKVIDAFETMQKQNYELINKVGQLEMKILEIEKSQKANIDNFTSKIKDKNDLIKFREKQVEQLELIIESTNTDQEQDLKYYKDNYLQLFNKVSNFYLKCRKKGIFQSLPEDNYKLRKEFDDPGQMLDVCQQMIDIQTNQQYFQQYRSVLVSANMLLQQIFNDQNSVKYQPNQIFDDVSQYVDNLNDTIQLLQNQTKLQNSNSPPRSLSASRTMSNNGQSAMSPKSLRQINTIRSSRKINTFFIENNLTYFD